MKMRTSYFNEMTELHLKMKRTAKFIHPFFAHEKKQPISIGVETKKHELNILLADQKFSNVVFASFFLLIKPLIFSCDRW